MYATEHSMPTRVEWPDGSVLGPVRRKRFGKEGTLTLGRVGWGVSLLRAAVEAAGHEVVVVSYPM
jgi:hypothetical protein